MRFSRPLRSAGLPEPGLGCSADCATVRVEALAVYCLVLLMILSPLLGVVTDLHSRDLAHTLHVVNAVLRRAEEEP
jgi:hypothetical protein